MLSSPLFREGDTVTSGTTYPSDYTIADVGGCHFRDIYLLSAPYNMCRFDYRTFNEGERIAHWLSDPLAVH